MADALSEAQEEALRAPYFWCYISHRGRERLPSYRYRGSDESLLYNYVISPTLNGWLKRGLIPRFLHPNVITISGFMLVVATNFLLTYYSPTFREDVPAWAMVVTAVALCTYQWMDALDGKQARSLGLGSPLGLLCDHGCDSFNSTVTAMNICAILRYGPTLSAYLLWGMTVLCFFMNTWEEWYVGSLNLPIINGPNEGLLSTMLIFVWTAVVGQDWWDIDVAYGLDRKHIVLGLYCLASGGTMLGNVYNTLIAVRHHKNQSRGSSTGPPRSASSVNVPVHSSPAQLQAATKSIALSRLLPVVLIILAGFLWVLCSPTEVFLRHPRLILWSLGLLVSKCCAGCMLAHLCDDAYRPFCKTIAGFAALLAHAALPYILVWMSAQPRLNDLFRAVTSWAGLGESASVTYHKDPQDASLLIYEIAALAHFSIAHFTVAVTWEISRLLDINVFIVPAAIRRKRD